MRGSVGLVVLMLLTSVANAAPNEIKISPTEVRGTHVTFPRLTVFPDDAVKARVNAILAKREAEDHSDQSDCLKRVRDQHQDDSSYEWSTDVRVTYLSRHFLSLQISTEADCASAHPDNSQEPITIDLRTGTLVDWNRMFKPGFLSTIEKFSPNKGQLAAIYLSRYIVRYGKDDPDNCVGTIRDDDFLDTALWLDAKAGGFLVSPQLLFVVKNCGDDISIPPDQLAPFVADPALIEDLRTTTREKR